jgi:carbonic anhydrase/SulP family sulfate permease
MTESSIPLKTLRSDLTAGLVVSLVALPLCLGVALASGAPLISGLVAGIVGGILVAWLSGSHTSISGPAAGLTAIVATQIEGLGSFDAFLVAVILAGGLQVGLGLLKAGSLAAFFPSSVIKGLLAAIGIILILKQFPHLFGHDANWLGDLAFDQLDGENTFSEIVATFFNIHLGASLVGVSSLLLLVFWSRTPLKRSPVPAPLAVVVAGVLATLGLESQGELWAIGSTHLVNVPMADSLSGLVAALHTPDLAAITHPGMLLAAMTVAVVATLESLLNLEAVDKLDPQKRTSPPNRELIAQGVGNMTSGVLGGLPITSVVVRSSVGIESGGKTRLTSFVHGVLLLVLVAFLPGLLNRIPLASLAAVLMVTGFHLATPKLFRSMWDEGLSQFLPFVVTIAAIVLTDLLVGILIGLAGATFFILRGNLKSGLRVVRERHVSGEVLRVVFPTQVTFLNRAALLKALGDVLDAEQVVLDAVQTEHIDPDILDAIREFETEVAPAHGIGVSLVGFDDFHEIEDHIAFVDYTTLEVQQQLTPQEVLQLLKEGNDRFVRGEPIKRDSRRQVGVTSAAQYPLAVVLACMDSRISTEMIFDVGLGDVFSIRGAGNIVAGNELGSMEYGCGEAGARLLLVLGHSRCGAVKATVDAVASGEDSLQAAGYEHLPAIVREIAESVRAETETTGDRTTANEAFVDHVTLINVRRTMSQIRARSPKLRGLLEDGTLLLVGGIYDVVTGRVELLDSGGDQTG